MTDAETIAKGAQPVWRHTFDHPKHGPLEFTVPRMPLARDWLAHALVQEEIAPGLNNVLAAALAGLRTIIKVPVLEEIRHEDEDNPTHVTIERVLYDAMDDEDVDFPMLVWTKFFAWRMDLLSDRTKEQVKNSSGATSGDAGDGSSPATTDSPQPTLP